MFVAYIYAKHIPYKAGYLFSTAEKKYLLLDWPGGGEGEESALRSPNF
jgi:hypothetical protein